MGEDILRLDARQRLDVGKGLEQLGRHLIDALIRTLRREHHRQQKLVLIAELKLRFGTRNRLSQRFDRKTCTLFSVHLNSTPKFYVCSTAPESHNLRSGV